MTFTWVFVRGTERLEIQRSASPTATQLVVDGAGGDTRVYDFDDHAQLVAFHGDLEEDLAREGWALVEFVPERRSGADRRQTPRGTERRKKYAEHLRTETSGV